MSQPFVGEIRMFGGTFAPVDWAFCDGQLLAISDYDTLFNLIGPTYGGDGVNTFAVPDLRGRVPIATGQGPGLPNFVLAQKAGTETEVLSTAHLPVHSHAASGPASSLPATATDPTGRVFAVPNDGSSAYSTTPSASLGGGGTLASAGGGGAHSNMQPYLCVNFIIALFGVFPSQ